MQIYHILLSGLGRNTTYLDPGTGSLITQLLLAGLLGIGVAFRIYWDKIKGLFNKQDNNDTDISDPTSIEEDFKEDSDQKDD